MDELDYTCFYMGHGAMHYIQVIDSDYNVKKRILVDAGSKYYCFDEAIDFNWDYIKKEISKSEENQWILCLTHPHSDHYSFFIKFFNELTEMGKTDVLEKFWIGGISQEMCDIYAQEGPLSNNNEIIKGLKDLYPIITSKTFNVELLPFPCKIPKRLWNDGNVSLYCLFANLFSNDVGNVNDNSANYAVINDDKGNAIWVTGDTTGTTFNNLSTKCETKSMIKYLLQGKKVYMTAPHHGSYDTLAQHGFGDCKFENGDYQVSGRLPLLLNNLGVTNYALIVSADYQDQYNHPDGLALGIYSCLCANAENDYSWPVYREPEHSNIAILSGKKLYGEEISNNVWFWQNLPNEISSTVVYSPRSYPNRMEVAENIIFYL